MTHEEVKKALTVLKSAYPNTFKNLSSGEAQNILALYTQMLSEYPSDVVFVAIKNYIKENEYAPTIAGIINEIKKITSDTTLQDLWNTLSSAVRNGLYTTEEEFQKLPYIFTSTPYFGVPPLPLYYNLKFVTLLNRCTYIR